MEKIEKALLDFEIEHWEDPTGPACQILHRYLRDAQRAYDRYRRALDETRTRQLRETSTAVRAITLEVNAPEPLKSELASFRQRIFPAAPPAGTTSRQDVQWVSGEARERASPQ
jgi:predicted DsbA family dithiol-disulfide isomerase